MSVIRDHCQLVQKSLLIALDHKPLNAAYLLGKMYCLPESASEPDQLLIVQTLQIVKTALTRRQVQKLAGAIISMPTEEWAVKDEENKTTLTALKQAFIRDLDYIGHLEPNALCQIGAAPDLFREAFIALIRQHLQALQQTDPFASPSFSYDLLQQAAPEQNHAYLAAFIEQCSSLPHRQIVALGNTQQRAMLLLTDLTGSRHRFQSGSQFARQYPALRTQIATDWANYLHSLPVEAPLRSEIEGLLIDLQADYPEFRQVDVNARIANQLENIPVTQNKTESVLHCMLGASVSAFNGMFFLATASTPLKVAVASYAGPYFVPGLLFGMALGQAGKGIRLAYRQRQEQRQQEKTGMPMAKERVRLV